MGALKRQEEEGGGDMLAGGPTTEVCVCVCVCVSAHVHMLEIRTYDVICTGAAKNEYH